MYRDREYRQFRKKQLLNEGDWDLPKVMPCQDCIKSIFATPANYHFHCMAKDNENLCPYCEDNGLKCKALPTSLIPIYEELYNLRKKFFICETPEARVLALIALEAKARYFGDELERFEEWEAEQDRKKEEEEKSGDGGRGANGEEEVYVAIRDDDDDDDPTAPWIDDSKHEQGIEINRLVDTLVIAMRKLLSKWSIRGYARGYGDGVKVVEMTETDGHGLFQGMYMRGGLDERDEEDEKAEEEVKRSDGDGGDEDGWWKC